MAFPTWESGLANCTCNCEKNIAENSVNYRLVACKTNQIAFQSMIIWYEYRVLVRSLSHLIVHLEVK